MWKRKEEVQPTPAPAPVPFSSPNQPIAETKTVVAPVAAIQERKPEPMGLSPEPPKSTSVAHIGKSVVIRGELSGSEDLFIDGQVEGTIELRDHNLTIGPNGRVDAHVNAKEVILLGSVKGNITASDKVEIKKSGSLNGDLVAARVMIEDGAYFKGSIDIQKNPKAAPKQETKKPETQAAFEPVGSMAGSSSDTKKTF